MIKINDVENYMKNFQWIYASDVKRNQNKCLIITFDKEFIVKKNDEIELATYNLTLAVNKYNLIDL